MKAFVHVAAILITTMASLSVSVAQAQGTYHVQQMTPETALKAAQTALAACRNSGFQVAVAVVDRSGVVQALIRDRLAGPHTPDTAMGKGWTAISFRTDTLSLVKHTQSDQLSSGVRQLPNVVVLGGGVPIQAGGNTVGAIGVSGAPSGQADDDCARAGILAIQDELNF